jgi:septal ring factor EnvC (AmiA/AmiB activator)
MALPNIKTFVIAVCKPFVWALRCFYDGQVAYLKTLAERQNEIITELQRQIADLETAINENSQRVIEYTVEIQDLKTKVVTTEEVALLATRNRQLELICGALYDKVYEMIHTGTVQDPTLPDFRPTENK